MGVSFSLYMEIRIVPSANTLKATDKNVGVSYGPYMDIRDALDECFFSVYIKIEMRESLHGCVFQSKFGDK